MSCSTSCTQRSRGCRARLPPMPRSATSRAALRRTFETNLESNSFWLGQLSTRYRYWLDQLDGSYPSGDALLGSLLVNGASIDAVTPVDIQELARCYADLDNRVRVTLLPEPK